MMPACFTVPGIEREDEMLVVAVMNVLCTTGVIFCLRFLVALFKECEPRRSRQTMQVLSGSGETPNAESQQDHQHAPRAA
jgi:hypothetical protein